MNATFDYNDEDSTSSPTCVSRIQVPLKEQKRHSERIAGSKKKHVATKEQKRHSERGKREKVRSEIHSPLRNQLSLELSYFDSRSSKSKRTSGQPDIKSPRKQFHLSLDNKPSSSKKLSRSTTQPNLKKESSTKSIQRTSTVTDLKNSSHEPSTVWQREPAKSTKQSTQKQRQLSLDITSSKMTNTKRTRPGRRASMDTSRAPSSSGKSSHEPKRGVARTSSLDLDLSLVPDSKPPSRASKPPKRSVSLSELQVAGHNKKGESKLRKAAQKKAESKVETIMEEVEAPKEQQTTPKNPDKPRREPKRGLRRTASLDFNPSQVPESKASKPSSSDKPRREPKRGVRRTASLDFDLSLVPESKASKPSSSDKPSREPKRGVRRTASLDFDLSQVPESKQPSEAPKEEQSTITQQPLDSTSPKMMTSKRTKPMRRASMDTSRVPSSRSISSSGKPSREPKRGVRRTASLDFDLSQVTESKQPSKASKPSSSDKPRNEPKRGVRRTASLDFDLSQVPESKQPPRSKPPKRTVSLSASQVSHKGESKLRKAAQMKAERSKPKKVVQWSDRIRGKKALDYSDVDPYKIWYSPQEIKELRETEKEVIQGIALGYSRACRDSALLNVEGLFSKKQQLEMSGRRASSKKAVFGFSRGGYFPTEGAIAEQYEEFSRPASKSAQKRAARLSSHVFGLWNAHQDDNDSDTWSDVDIEALGYEDAAPDPPRPEPSIYSQNCMAHRIRRRTSITNIISSSLSSPPSSSHKTVKDGDGEPTVWRSFKRRMSITPSQ